MTKMHLEIGSALGSVALFVILIAAVQIFIPESSGYGYTAALLIFMVVMGAAGLKLAEIPDK
jgi:uncharacterized membrane protein YccC